MTGGPGEAIWDIEGKREVDFLSLNLDMVGFFFSSSVTVCKKERFTVPCRRQSWPRCGPRREFLRRGAASGSCTEQRAGQSVEDQLAS